MGGSDDAQRRPNRSAAQQPTLQPCRFISEPINARFDTPPVIEKRPGCPTQFLWQGQPYIVSESLSEWVDFSRRGRYGHNMRAGHLAAAAKRGSWGVGRFYFRVRTRCGRYFDLYYDRRPRGVDERKGSWTLFQELSPAP